MDVLKRKARWTKGRKVTGHCQCTSCRQRLLSRLTLLPNAAEVTLASTYTLANVSHSATENNGAFWPSKKPTDRTKDRTIKYEIRKVTRGEAHSSASPYQSGSSCGHRLYHTRQENTLRFFFFFSFFFSTLFSFLFFFFFFFEIVQMNKPYPN